MKKIKRMTLVVEDDFHKVLKKFTTDRDMSMSLLVRRLLKEYIEREQLKERKG